MKSLIYILAPTIIGYNEGYLLGIIVAILLLFESRLNIMKSSLCV